MSRAALATWSRPPPGDRRPRLRFGPDARVGFITQEEYDAAVAEEVVLAPPDENEYLAPHFVYAVRREAGELLEGEDLLDTGGLRIITTLDYEGYQVSAEKWAMIGYDLDRLSDEELIAKYGEDAHARSRSSRAGTSTTTRS